MTINGSSRKNQAFAKEFSKFLRPLRLTRSDLETPVRHENADDEIRIWDNGTGAVQTADEIQMGLSWEDFQLNFIPNSGNTTVVDLTATGAFTLPQLEEGVEYALTLSVKKAS